MRYWEQALESTTRNEALCLSLAAGLHVLALIWNPIILRSDWHPPHDFVTVDLVEQLPPGAEMPAGRPAKMSLLETLKDMLLKPKTEELAPAASQPVVPQPPHTAQALLKEVTRPRPIAPKFQPRSQTDDIVGAKAPDAIQTPARPNVSLPTPAPTLKAKAFGGIRAKDLPFQVSGGEEALATGGPSAIPVAVGNSSAKSALGYSAPALQESQRRRVGLQGAGTRIPREDVSTLTTASPAPIALAGTGTSGTIPAQGGTSSLQQRRGSRVGAALTGRSGYSSASYGGGLETMPSAARELDAQITMGTGSGAGGRGLRKSFEIAGPLTNRTIVHKVIPQYPAWAEEQGIIGSVRLYFTVTPEGAVRLNIRVTKTTGYPQLDQLAVDALKQWQFAPLGAGEEGTGQWGLITFNFSLT